MKSFHSFKGIAEDFWDGVRIRREKALDSPYDFVNYWTFGISDGIVSGANERSAKMFDSKLDFLNYATFGFSGMFKEAILPDDPLSKEHWQNSFGFVGSIIGLRLAATTSPVKKPGNAAADGKVTNEGKNVTEITSKTSISETWEGISNGMGKSGADNIALHAKFKEVLEVTASANPIVDSLKQTGQLPLNYANKEIASLSGWRPGKALNNYLPGGQLGGDVFKNTNNVLPNAPGRVWFEADIGINNTMSRSKQPGTRLLYSNDGQMYITTDHYKTVHFIGTYR